MTWTNREVQPTIDSVNCGSDSSTHSIQSIESLKLLDFSIIPPPWARSTSSPFCFALPSRRLGQTLMALMTSMDSTKTILLPHTVPCQASWTPGHSMTRHRLHHGRPHRLHLASPHRLHHGRPHRLHLASPTVRFVLMLSIIHFPCTVPGRGPARLTQRSPRRRGNWEHFTLSSWIENISRFPLQLQTSHAFFPMEANFMFFHNSEAAARAVDRELIYIGRDN